MLVNRRDTLKEYLDLSKTYRNSLTLRLFTNDHTPADNDVAEDYTEATFTGYAPVNPLNWSDAVINDGGYAESVEQVRGWIVTAPSAGQQVYGYYLTDGDGFLVWAERAAGAPTAMSAVGAAYVVYPRVTFKNET